jgi:hypothetical protein
MSKYLLVDPTLTNGLSVSNLEVDGYSIDLTSGASVNQVLIYDGYAFSAASIATSNANQSDYQLTTTSPTNVVSFTPITQGNFIIYVFYRVANATTDVSLSINWTDITGSGTLILIPLATSIVVGSYPLPPVYINAITSGAITVSATTGTANNLYVSASIIGIN